MKKRKRVFLEESKLDNALYNLTRYINFLDAIFFGISVFATIVGFLMSFLGVLNNDFDNLRNGFLVILITVSANFLIIKPIIVIMYAIAKLLINKETQTKNI